ncbi:MAG TPA: hypothetical protein VN193_06815 [Candidatus Angelobacter sp.]|jgi:hypothetical protein|nr:hypothetical protein [Candidatus Angelobacter sp.]
MQASTVTRPRLSTRNLAGRIATGAFILHSGTGKWNADEARATQTHAFAAGAFPFLGKLPPQKFMKLLAGSEIALGAALLAPVVPGALAGAALTAFSGSLLAMYLRTPALHEPRSFWPTPAGIAVSKDIWMLGIGMDLVLGARRD